MYRAKFNAKYEYFLKQTKNVCPVSLHFDCCLSVKETYLSRSRGFVESVVGKYGSFVHEI